MPCTQIYLEKYQYELQDIYTKLYSPALASNLASSQTDIHGPGPLNNTSEDAGGFGNIRVALSSPTNPTAGQLEPVWSRASKRPHLVQKCAPPSQGRVSCAVLRRAKAEEVLWRMLSIEWSMNIRNMDH
jgi:hypothetical protein